MLRLTLVSGPGTGTHYPLQDTRMTIGRGGENSISLSSSRVSKLHCVIEIHQKTVVVEDQNSSNGTFVNGSLVQKKALLPGDRLSVGEFIFELNEKLEKVSSHEVYSFSNPSSQNSLALTMGDLGGQAVSQEVETSVQPPPSDLMGRAIWIFQTKIMPIFYELNGRYEWKILCCSIAAVYVLLNVFLLVAPVIQADQQNLIKEIHKRSRFVAKQLAEQNAAFIAAGTETRTSLGIIENADGVKSAYLTDLDLRILAPGVRFNQYLSGGPEAIFAVEMRDQFRQGKNEYTRSRYDSLTDSVIAIEPVKILNPTLGRNQTVAMAIVLIDSSLSTLDVGETSLIYSKTLIITSLLAGLLFSILYHLTLRPLHLLNEDLDKGLKGELSEVTRPYKFPELDSLLDLINSALLRIPNHAQNHMGGDLGGGEDEMSSLVSPIRMIGGLVKFGLVALDGKKRVVFLNPIFEELSGIRLDQAIGHELSEVARDQSLGAFTTDLMTRVLPGSEGLIEDYDFSGVPFKVYVTSFGEMGGSPKGYLLATSKADE